MADDLIGKNISGYEILDVIGRGGMATVYRAQQKSMNRVVALKVLPEQYIHDDTYIQRFNQEVEIVAKLEHRNIVPVYDYGEHEGRPYIVMRYMSGGSVDDLLANGPLEIEQIVDIYDQIAPALDYAHSKHVLHRDIKPSNVLLDDGGGAYLTDFGIARILGESGNRNITTQGVVGTPSYMSPEQAQGQPLDNRSDIYALGIMLFELATGRRPFESDTPYSIAVMQVTTPPPAPRSLNPAISLAVEEVIYKSLKKKREERYPHAIALSEALKRAMNKPVSSIHDTQPGMPRPPLRQQPVMEARPAAPIPPPVTPPPAYSAPPARPATPNAPPARGAFRRKRRNSSGVWMSAAAGGLLGCGLLVVLIVIALIILSTVLNRPDDSGNPSPTLSGALVPNGAPGIGLVYFTERDRNFDLFRLDLESGEEAQLTDSPRADTYPNVSPDGRQVAFQSNRENDFDIYVMDIDGNNVRNITNNNVDDRLPAWSPDGQWIIFASQNPENSQAFDLYQVRPDGSDLQVILANDKFNSHPRWSPDATTIVYTSGEYADAATYDIYLLDVATGAITRLTNNSYRDQSPNFSPDGSQIVFITGGENDGALGNAAVAVMNRDGSNRRILYDGAGFETSASYSPDGQYITFTSSSATTDEEEVFIMRADGTRIEQLTQNGGLAASWIPG